MNKYYYYMPSIGRSKHVVSFHDGVKKHKDGGEFMDIKIFKSKVKARIFVKELVKQGFYNNR